MDDDPVIIPNDIVAERMTAYCSLIAQIEAINPKQKALKDEALEFLKAVRATITPKAEPAPVLQLHKGGAVKPL